MLLSIDTGKNIQYLSCANFLKYPVVVTMPM